MIIEEEVYFQEIQDLGEDYLEHFGVKGMQWGVRKQRLRSGARTAGRRTAKIARDPRTIAALKTGATITAVLLAGGIGAIAVSTLVNSGAFKGGTTQAFRLPPEKTIVIGSPNNLNRAN